MKSYIDNELKRNKITKTLEDNQGIEPRTYIGLLASDRYIVADHVSITCCISSLTSLTGF